MAHSGLGWIAVCAARIATAPGTTIRFGTIRCLRSIAETATSAAQKPDATAASHVSPNLQTQPAINSAVASSTAG